jgi:hypothetical protein
MLTREGRALVTATLTRHNCHRYRKAKPGSAFASSSMTPHWREPDSNCQFRDASQPPRAWALSFGGERRLLETPTVDRPQFGRLLETAAYLARNSRFESIPLHRRVGCEPHDRPLTSRTPYHDGKPHRVIRSDIVILHGRRADISGAHRGPRQPLFFPLTYLPGWPLQVAQTAIKLTAALYRRTPGTLNRKRQLE